MHPTPSWVERLARIGIVVKGIVYLAIGSLATGVALESGGVLTGGEGLLRLFVAQPMGRVLLGLLALGLAAYTLWLFAQALMDPDGNGTSPAGLANRFGQALTGLAHAALTWESVRLALGLPSGEDAGIEALAGAALRAPLGPWLLRAAGAVVLVIGAIQIWRGLFGDLRRARRLSGLPPDRAELLVRIGRFGLASRGIVMGVAGWLVLRAAAAYAPERAGGVGDALAELWKQPASHWLLGAVALGLVAYGVFSLIEARYRLIPSA